MSKTDKTQPWEVKLRQNPQMRVEDHDHRKGYCDMVDGVIKEHVRWYGSTYRTCGHKFAKEHHYTSGIYGRPRSGQFYVQKRNAKERTRVRLAFRDMIKLDADGIEDYDFQNYQHRHSAHWDMW